MDKPSLCTTPSTTPPPGAHPEILTFDTAEDVVLASATKRNNQDLFTKIKCTKTNHPLNLPYKRAVDSSSTNSSLSYNKKIKP